MAVLNVTFKLESVVKDMTHFAFKGGGKFIGSELSTPQRSFFHNLANQFNKSIVRSSSELDKRGTNSYQTTNRLSKKGVEAFSTSWLYEGDFDLFQYTRWA